MNVWNPGAVLDIINSHYRIKTEKDFCMFTEMIFDMDIEMVLTLWYCSSYRYELYICICIWLVDCGFSSLSGVSYNSPNFSRFVGIVLASFCSLIPPAAVIKVGQCRRLSYLSLPNLTLTFEIIACWYFWCWSDIFVLWINWFVICPSPLCLI